MIATTSTWAYADRFRHKIRSRASFSFSDVRRIVVEETLSPDFQYRIMDEAHKHHNIGEKHIDLYCTKENNQLL